MSAIPPAQVDQLAIIPIIKDNSERRVIFGEEVHPVATFGPPPDRIIGYRLYVRNMGIKSIIEVRADDTSAYNLINWYNIDWPDSEALRNEIDSEERLP